jgi:hypothetical protein
MVAAAGGTSPYPGVEILLDGAAVASALEIEFKYTDFTLRGGLGTTGDGVLMNEGQRLWVHAIGTGAVTQESAGIGEVTAGTLIGYVAIGAPTDAESDAVICNATDHTFTLKIR